MSRTVRLAAAQYRPDVGDVERNRAEAVRWASAAADAGAVLAVLPELASSGYVFRSREEAAAAAEDPREGAFATALREVCAERGLHVVAGLDERDGDALHNSAVLVGPSGTLAVYRKLHLFHDEQRWFTQGDDLPVVELPFGRVGMAVCFDLWFPETVRSQALAGAEIIAVPTNWVASFKSTVYDERGYCQGDYAAMVTAAQNGVVMACADRIGVEREVRFLGASLIVDADGWPVGGPAAAEEEALVVADVDLDGVERARRRTPTNHLLDDRRTDAYVRTRLVRAPVAAG